MLHGTTYLPDNSSPEEAGHLVMWLGKVRASRFESCPSHLLSTLPSAFWSADNADDTPPTPCENEMPRLLMVSSVSESGKVRLNFILPIYPCIISVEHTISGCFIEPAPTRDGVRKLGSNRRSWSTVIS